jgi:hypothetical protein
MKMFQRGFFYFMALNVWTKMVIHNKVIYFPKHILEKVLAFKTFYLTLCKQIRFLSAKRFKKLAEAI